MATDSPSRSFSRLQRTFMVVQRWWSLGWQAGMGGWGEPKLFPLRKNHLSNKGTRVLWRERADTRASKGREEACGEGGARKNSTRGVEGVLNKRRLFTVVRSARRGAILGVEEGRVLHARRVQANKFSGENPQDLPWLSTPTPQPASGLRAIKPPSRTRPNRRLLGGLQSTGFEAPWKREKGLGGHEKGAKRGGRDRARKRRARDLEGTLTEAL